MKTFILLALASITLPAMADFIHNCNDGQLVITTEIDPDAPFIGTAIIRMETLPHIMAVYAVEGLEHSWYWDQVGDNGEFFNYSFVINPDGAGRYYDFSHGPTRDESVMQKWAVPCIFTTH